MRGCVVCRPRTIVAQVIEPKAPDTRAVIEPSEFGAPERGLAKQNDGSTADLREHTERREFSSMRYLGAASATFTYGGIVAILLGSYLQIDRPSLLASLMFLAVGVALVALVRWASTPWRLTIGLEGMVFDGRAIPWTAVYAVGLEAVPPHPRYGATTTRYNHVTVLARGARRVMMQVAVLDSATAVSIREEIHGRMKRANAVNAPEVVASVRREGRPISAWVAALSAAPGATFRTLPIETAALLDSMSRGALSGRAFVECAVAIVVLGMEEERLVLARLARSIADPSLARAVSAVIARRFDDPSVDRATR